MRPPRSVVVFRTLVAPSFARCRCGAVLTGLRCWSWLNRDGTRGYGCPRTCMFPAQTITAAGKAA